jgi:hypothetical protein
MNFSHRFRALNTELRILLFFGTLLFYSLFGVPTPDHPGMVEILTGFGLICAIGFPRAAFLFWNTSPGASERPIWMLPAWCLLVFGVTVGIAMAVVQGHAMTMVFRDIVPFLFMMLPLFAYELVQKISVRQKEYLLHIILLCGFIFAVRSIFIFEHDGYTDLDMLYLANAPTVLCAAIYFICTGILSFRFARPYLPVLLFILAVVPVMAMGDALQRASFGAIAISAIAVWFIVLRYSLLRAGILLVGVAVLYLIAQGYISPLISTLYEKHQNVGGNMRFQELEAVWTHVSQSGITALFGNGWGAPLASPAVGGLTVNFTHSLVSALLLKTGLIGTVLLAFYLGALAVAGGRFIFRRPALALALFWPFMIDIFLYASYKSLDFGLILLLIAVYGTEKEYIGDNKKKENEHRTHPHGQQDLSAVERADGASAL